MRRERKKLYFKYIMFFLVSIFLLLPMVGCSQIPEEEPRAVRGYLDLSNWDFDKTPTIRLDGEWEFYWNKLPTPDALKELVPDGYIRIPSSWGNKVREIQPSMHGAATYRLKVRIANPDITYGIKTTSIRMSNRIFIDGKELLSSGRPALSRDEYIFSNTPDAVSFYPSGNDIEIVIHVADYDYREGGIVQSIYLGKQKDIEMLATRNNFLNVFLAACLFITGIHYLFVFLGRHKDLSVLYYCLGLIGSKAYANQVAKIFEQDYDCYNVMVSSKGKYYLVEMFFRNKEDAKKICNDMIKRKYIVNYYFNH